MKTQLTVYLGEAQARQVEQLKLKFGEVHTAFPISTSAWLAYIVSEGIHAIHRSLTRGKAQRKPKHTTGHEHLT